VGENTPVGIITQSITPANLWTDTNYNIGDKVIYNHPVFGERIYTCIQNTINNEIPTNQNFWRHGFELSVSSTVTENTSTGYYIKITNGTNTDDLKRVISINILENKIYVEGNSTNNFSIGSFVLQSVYLLKDFPIGNIGEYSLGLSKIGGSHVPPDTIVRIYYTNLSDTEDKYFNGRLEYLY
jgi:hypothetical protein